MELIGAAWRKSSYSGSNGGDCVEVTAAWRKSSHSGDNGGACIEVAPAWRTSSHSGDNGGNCVEVAARLPRVVAVRDSKDPEGAALAFGTGAWQDFTGGIKRGEPAVR